jgi:hypothetical protein
MKIYFLTILLLFDVFFGDAQISTEEIKKYHIYKITEKSFVNDSLSETSALYYDKHGNIIKEISGGLTETITNIYENDRLKKVIYFGFNDKEEHTTEYFYNPDGSFMTITTEKIFEAKNYFWHKANGDIIKAFASDTFFYKYNEPGKLISVESGGNGQETKVHVRYSYNTKGQLIKVEMPTNEFHSITEIYEYDLMGKIIKATQKTILLGIPSVSVSTYEYNEKGLVVKEITIDSKEGAKTITTINIYEYEFYRT